MKTLYVIHHSHTDIGYTGRQERIVTRQVEFLRQALDLLERDPRFRWTAETFFCVERFLERADPVDRERLAAAVRSGAVGLSGTYLNLNELLDFEVLRHVTARAGGYGRSIGGAVTSAMTADINGFGWGFARALAETGVRNLFTCVHTHHGMYPLGGTQVPFWWEAPGGEQVLVWNGEHYHFGNELGVVPGAVSSYLTKDECDAEMIFGDPWGVAEIRIPRYFDRLNRDGYPFDFIPVMASGLRTDNAPPSFAILDFADRWNAVHGDEIRVEMTTLDGFFETLRAASTDFPVHRGDWPDWWSDGLAASPVATRLFRQAQRERSFCRSMGVAAESLREVDNLLSLYAEHTFGHADAMGRPWSIDVHSIAARKKAFASEALAATGELLDEMLAAFGRAELRPGRPLSYAVQNPFDTPMTGIARLSVGHYEYHELHLDRGAEVVDAGARLPSQPSPGPGSMDFCVPLALAPGEQRRLRLLPFDQVPDGGPTVPGVEPHLETDHVRIEWADGEGITRWVDRATGRDLLRGDRAHAPFTGVYERTPVKAPEEIGAVRGAMVLNRKGEEVRRYAARLIGSRPVEAGAAFVRSELAFELEGAGHCVVELTAHVAVPRVDVAFRIEKETHWEPENLYLSLPFTTGLATEEFLLFKAGAVVRPRVDQVPGTLTDFYCLQEGFALTEPGFGIVVAMLDGPLLQLGPLEHGERLRMGDPRLEADPALPYAWLMTNYWETNFDASLGGFHEFRYSLCWGPDLGEVASAREAARAMGHGPVCYRLGE